MPDTLTIHGPSKYLRFAKLAPIYVDQAFFSTVLTGNLQFEAFISQSSQTRNICTLHRPSGCGKHMPFYTASPNCIVYIYMLYSKLPRMAINRIIRGS